MTTMIHPVVTMKMMLKQSSDVRHEHKSDDNTVYLLLYSLVMMQ